MAERALLVCFGGMSNVGTLTGLAALEVARAGEGTIFCLASLANGDPVVQKRLKEAERIVAVDGCPLACARRIAERAGFPPHRAIVLAQDLGIKKGLPDAVAALEVQRAVAFIRAALGDEDR
ncbi:putative zinc-binding protein [Candidatus Bipolaricaulota bacterium]|nr:putative zinc-binding protein [Candidatus Bipolaricaulota bacterium]